MVGASGYVGKAVALACRRDGYTVYAQSRNFARTQEFVKEEFVPLICDPTDQEALLDVVDKCQFVIDCTSVIMDGEKIPNACLEAIRACKSRDKHFIFTSGLLVYGEFQISWSMKRCRENTLCSLDVLTLKICCWEKRWI